MNIWILTIGSSDIQLKTKANWGKRFGDVRSELDDRGFTPSNGNEGRFQVPARVMGVVYSQPKAEQNFDDLVFPLIDNFLSKIKDQPIDKVILVLGDQSIFQPAERSSQNHAYWQDTCTLQPLLEKYLKQELEKNSPNLQFQPLFLKIKSTTEGLDDWNAVLKLVQDEFSSLDFPDNATIYVSHQAGTPAISSAVQFASLSQFGNQVEFLVSNERDAKLTKILSSSAYLKGIRKKEAEALLKSHNYSGVKNLLDSYLNNEKHQETKILLEAAIQWNFAKFDEFAHELQKLSDQDLAQVVKERSQHYWWTAYEAAYLAFVRLDQKNAVEAFFHSFRAVEGLISKWAEICFPDHVDPNNDSPKLKISILDVFPDYLGKKDQAKQREDFEERKTLVLSGFPLYALLRADRPNWKTECRDFSIFTDKIAPKRNKLFHRLKGLQTDEVFKEWEVSSYTEWANRILKYLNFVAQQSFSTLEDASLMAIVHKKLEKAIVSL